MGITAVVHTYNSQKSLYACLESLVGCVEEILVCDMHSTDETVAIAQTFGARIIYHSHTGFAESARDFAVRQASQDWVFILDSDEVAPAPLWPLLREKMALPEGTCNGVLIPCKNVIWGKPLRAAYPDRKLRFFRRSKFQSWPTLVHRGAIVEGPLFVIPGAWRHMAIQHSSYGSIEEFVEKMNRYTSLELVKLREKGIGNMLLAMTTRPVLEFIKRYVGKKGFLDGVHGWVFAVMMAQYKFVAIAKLWHERMGSTMPPVRHDAEEKAVRLEEPEQSKISV